MSDFRDFVALSESLKITPKLLKPEKYWNPKRAFLDSVNKKINRISELYWAAQWMPYQFIQKGRSTSKTHQKDLAQGVILMVLASCQSPSQEKSKIIGMSIIWVPCGAWFSLVCFFVCHNIDSATFILQCCQTLAFFLWDDGRIIKQTVFWTGIWVEGIGSSVF